MNILKKIFKRNSKRLEVFNNYIPEDGDELEEFIIKGKNFKLFIYLSERNKKILESVKNSHGYLQFRSHANKDLGNLHLVKFILKSKGIEFNSDTTKSNWESIGFFDAQSCMNDGKKIIRKKHTKIMKNKHKQ